MQPVLDRSVILDRLQEVLRRHLPAHDVCAGQPFRDADRLDLSDRRKARPPVGVNRHPIMSHFGHSRLTRSEEWVFGVGRSRRGKSGKVVSRAGRRHPMFREACLPEHWADKFFQGIRGPSISPANSLIVPCAVMVRQSCICGVKTFHAVRNFRIARIRRSFRPPGSRRPSGRLRSRECLADGSGAGMFAARRSMICF